MIDERAQLALMAAAFAGITEGRLAANDKTIARPIPDIVSKDFELPVRHLVAAQKLEEAPDCTAVHVAAQRVGEAVGDRMAEPMILLWPSAHGFTLHGRVALMVKTASGV